MTVSMMEIGLIVFLVMVTAVLVISFMLTLRAKNKYNQNVITRGMNGVEGDNIQLTCPTGQVISFKFGNTPSTTTRGAIIAVGDTRNCDAFYQSAGQNQHFFNPDTTINVFGDGKTEFPQVSSCEGKQNCSFIVPSKSDIASKYPNLCIGKTSGTVGFVGTYDCVPK